MGDLHIHDFLHGVLNFLQARIAELIHQAAFGADYMIVLFVLVGFLELRYIFSKLMLNNQFAVLKQLYGVVKGGPANAVLVIFHFDIERLHIKMAFGEIDLTQNGKTFGRFPVPVGREVGRKNVFNGFVNLLKCLGFPHLSKIIQF